MATSFDRWEKDPFFSAAEEVQESADRMESTYRTWIHAKKDASNILDAKELCRDLHTALGTTKWQLEEFAKAVQSSYKNGLADDARDRHREFISAIEDQISKIENSLEESARSEGKVSLPWVRLDEGECSELALFLSGPSVPNDKTIAKVDEGDCSELALFLSGPSAPNAKTIAKVNGNDNEVLQAVAEDSAPNHLKNSIQSVGCSSDAREEKLHGHRRTASASAGIGAWQIAINDDSYLQNSSNGQLPIPPRKIPSVSGFLNSMESAAKLNWSKNGNRKWKAADRFQEADTALLRSSQLTRGINACYEKSKSCLDSCDDYYDKQLYGWYGAIQRQLQRSQYQMQYSRPVQVTFWIVVLLCLIALITLYAI